MSDEAKQPGADETTAKPKAAPDFVRDSVTKAIEQVKGEGTAPESATTPEPPKAAAAGDKTPKTEAAKAEESQEDGTQKTEEEQPTVLAGDDLRKYMKETPLWQLDLKRLPEEFRTSARTLQRRATKDFQSLADQRKELEGKPDRKTKTETKPQETSQRDGGEKILSDDELYEMAMGSPDGLRKAFNQMLKQEVPSMVKATTEEEQSRQREYMESQSLLASDAVENLTETIPEFDNDDFKAAVTATIESNPRIAKSIADASTLEEMEDAIELAARRTRETFKPKTPVKPVDEKAQDRKEREQLNAKEKGSIAARKGSKVGTAEEGPMTVEKSIRLAKDQIARGVNVV